MQAYAFTPQAADADEDFLEFSITNQPSWATFSDTTGTLTGTPVDANVGDTDDITITVSDGRDTRSIGPFKIRIHPRNNPPPANTAPTISGAPATTVMAISSPTASSRPRPTRRQHAHFAIHEPSVVGELQHVDRPSVGHAEHGNVATYSNIVISVSDGHASAALPRSRFRCRVPRIARPRSPVRRRQRDAAQSYTFQPGAAMPTATR